MSNIPAAVDNVTLINASYLNSIKDAVEDIEDGTVPAGSLDIDALPGPGMDAIDGENDSIVFFNNSATEVQKIRPNALLKIGNAGAGSLGELLTWDGTDSVALSVGADGEVLTADSNAPYGIAWAPGGGGSAVPSVMDGRLTLTSGTPVTTSDVTAASTIYLTPFNGNQVALYDGSAWQYHTLTERSLSLSGLTSGANYDVWLYDNSGTLTLELSTAWTNDTTRADAVATQDGVRVKSGAPERRLVGTIRTTGTTTTEDSDAKRFVRNERHPVRKKLRFEQTGSTWTYNTATWRVANNNANAKVEALTSGREMIRMAYHIRLQATAGVARIAVGVDGEATPDGEAINYEHRSNYTTARAQRVHMPSEGYHYWQPYEAPESGGGVGCAAPGYTVGEVMV